MDFLQGAARRVGGACGVTVGVGAPLHEDRRQAGVRDGRKHVRIRATTGDVIDIVHADFCTGTSDGCAHRIHTGDDAAGCEFAHNRHDAREFLFFGHAGCAGTGGFPADVDDVRAVINHLFGVRQCTAGVEVIATVGKRILGDVQDAHHEGAAWLVALDCAGIVHDASPSSDPVEVWLGPSWGLVLAADEGEHFGA